MLFAFVRKIVLRSKKYKIELLETHNISINQFSLLSSRSLLIHLLVRSKRCDDM